LHTGDITAKSIKAEFPDINSRDIDPIIKLNQFLDGKEAIVITSLSDPNEFWYMGMENSVDAKEAAYLMEQDSETGTFINNRTEFNQVWDSGNYCSDVWHIFKKEQVEIIGSFKN
jgi:hypothetical protein